MTAILSNLYQVIGLGKFDDNSHPVHPATVHFPITFLSLSYGLDTLYGLSTTPSTSGTVVSLANSLGINLLAALQDVSRASHFSNILGLITAVPATATGVAELYAMISGQGLWEEIKRESDGKVVYKGMNPKVRHGIAHALLNDVALAASAYNWWSKRNVPNFEPSGTNIAISVLMLPSLFFSAYLGGAMVYKYGVAVMRMGEAAKIKEDMGKDELKKKDGQTQIKERKGE